MTGTDGIKSFETLDVQVKALEGDVRDIKTSIASLGAEVRQALTNVTSQFAMQQRTPWMSIGSIGAVLIAVLSFIGTQALNPIISDIKLLKDNSFPKEEAIFRYSINDKRLTQIETDFRLIQQRRYDEINKQLDQIELENRELRHKSAN